MSRKRPDLKRQLALTRARLRGMREISEKLMAGGYTVSGGSAPVVVPVRDFDKPAKFVQCWAVGRGFAAVTQALDEDGQVWERVSLIEKDTSTGKKTLTSSWWERVDMTRKG